MFTYFFTAKYIYKKTKAVLIYKDLFICFDGGTKSVNLKNIIYGNKLIFKTLDPNNYRFIYKKNFGYNGIY